MPSLGVSSSGVPTRAQRSFHQAPPVSPPLATRSPPAPTPVSLYGPSCLRKRFALDGQPAHSQGFSSPESSEEPDGDLKVPFKIICITLGASAAPNRRGRPRKHQIPTQTPASQRPPGTPTQTGPPREAGGGTEPPARQGSGAPLTPGRLVALIQGGCLEEAVQGQPWPCSPRAHLVRGGSHGRLCLSPSRVPEPGCVGTLS